MPSCQAEPYITAGNSPLPGPEGVHIVPPDPGSAWLFCVTLGRGELAIFSSLLPVQWSGSQGVILCAHCDPVTPPTHKVCIPVP